MLVLAPHGRSSRVVMALCKQLITSTISGRNFEVSSKHRCAKAHISLVTARFFGHSGRSPDKTFATTEVGVLFGNGAAPLNT
jgi:hypothetical protein